MVNEFVAAGATGLSLTGNEFDNRLYGGTGNDTLNGGKGNNILTGGGGADLFILTSPGTLATPETDKITDFTPAVDKLGFRDAGFNLGVDEHLGTATPQPLDPSLFSSNADGTFATSANRFAYNAAAGKLYYDADGSGAGHVSQLIATLTNHPTLTAADLVFVA